MRFFGNVFAWLVAVGVAYIFASTFSTQFVLATNVGNVPFGMRVASTLRDIQGTTLYAIVIALGFLVAFIIASLLKAVLPFLSAVAYPIAGGAAIATALGLMFLQFGQVPVSGAVYMPGFIFQIVAGAIGGLAFEMLRPKTA